MSHETIVIIMIEIYSYMEPITFLSLMAVASGSGKEIIHFTITAGIDHSSRLLPTQN